QVIIMMTNINSLSLLELRGSFRRFFPEMWVMHSHSMERGEAARSAAGGEVNQTASLRQRFTGRLSDPENTTKPTNLCKIRRDHLFYWSDGKAGMDVLTLLALVNVILWGGAFVVLWWVNRAESALDAEIAALE